MKIKTTVEVDGNEALTQKHWLDGKKLTSNVINTQDPAVIEGLKQLGWTPPNICPHCKQNLSLHGPCPCCEPGHENWVKCKQESTCKKPENCRSYGMPSCPLPYKSK